MPARKQALISIVLALAWLAAAPARAATDEAAAIAAEEAAKANAYCHPADGLCIASDSYADDVCTAIETYAATEGLPAGFFARLVWQESRFDLNALSPAGAEGIAQFMPGTGRLRGLGNAFNPAEALERSADYLAFLTRKFGNLGLAAAAYNGGEGRMGRYVGGSGGYLPAETEDYVRIITGYSAAQWLVEPPEDVDFALAADQPFHDACLQLAATREIAPFAVPEDADWQPWGVQVAADFSAAVAQRLFERVRARYAAVIGDEAAMLVAARNPSFGSRLRYHARIGRQTREEALALCQDLQAAGGVCIVVEN